MNDQQIIQKCVNNGNAVTNTENKKVQKILNKIISRFIKAQEQDVPEDYNFIKCKNKFYPEDEEEDFYIEVEWKQLKQTIIRYLCLQPNDSITRFKRTYKNMVDGADGVKTKWK